MALLIITADKCTVILVDSAMACILIGQSFAHFASVFCVPVGVML